MSTTDAQDFEAELDTARSERVQLLFGFSPFEYQAELLDQQEDIVKAAVKPGRQVGKTVTGGAIAADASLAGKDVMILGPFEDTVSEMMEAAREHLLTAEENYSSAGHPLGTDYRNKTDWKFSHSGRLRARTVGTDGTQIRGKNPEVVLVDEAAYIKDNIFTEVIEPFFSTHNNWEYYLFSTPAGKSGYFYEKVEQDSTFYSPHWPSSICPLISEEWLHEKRTELDRQTYAQEYLGEFVEAADSYFPHELVNPCVSPGPELEARTQRWLGVDPAEKGDDRMVIYDLDATGTTWNIWSQETTTGPEFVGLLSDLQTNTTVPEPDIGPGTTPTDGYERIVVESNIAGLATDIAEANLGGVILPVKSTRKSKGPMYKRLKRDLEATEIQLPNYRRLLDQLTSLQYSYTANNHLKLEHPPGGHDDYPDALMLANAGRVGLAQNFGADTSRTSTKPSAAFNW